MYPINFTSNHRCDVVYSSDIHSNTKYTPKFATGANQISKQNKQKGISTFIALNGDIIMGNNIKTNTYMFKVANFIKTNVLGLGNKEIESGDYFVKAYKSAKPKFPLTSINLNFSKPNIMENKIAHSVISEKNGDKVGFINVTAFDSTGEDRINFKSDFNDYITVKDFETTEKAIREEIKNLENLGIKKIILLAHTGKNSKNGMDYYENLGRIGGIKMVIGGHDHIERNYWIKSELGYPVKVVSVEAGNDFAEGSEDLAKFGHFKAVWDDNGILVPEKSRNVFRKSKYFKTSPEIKKLEDLYLRNKKVIGYLEESLDCSQRKTRENPVANLLADAMLWIAKKNKSKAQIALINSGEIRSGFKKGKITVQDVKGVFRFTENVTLVETQLSKKELFEALNHGVQTTLLPKQTLGLLQVGGMSYEVKNNKVVNVHLLDSKGNLGQCLDKMPDNFKINAIYDTYLMEGSGGMNSLKRNILSPEVKVYPYNHRTAVLKYIEKAFANKSIKVKTGRILSYL